MDGGLLVSGQGKEHTPAAALAVAAGAHPTRYPVGNLARTRSIFVSPPSSPNPHDFSLGSINNIIIETNLITHNTDPLQNP